MSKKSFFKCSICGDIHYGVAGPKTCPTCQTKDAYKPIETDKAKESMGF